MAGSRRGQSKTGDGVEGDREGLPESGTLRSHRVRVPVEMWAHSWCQWTRGSLGLTGEDSLISSLRGPISRVLCEK
jgi:hypothetical protein